MTGSGCVYGPGDFEKQMESDGYTECSKCQAWHPKDKECKHHPLYYQQLAEDAPK